MMTTVLLNLLLLLCIVWLSLVIALFLGLLLHTRKGQEEKPSLAAQEETHEQLEDRAAHLLVVPSKPTISRVCPTLPDSSSKEKRAEEAPTFAAATAEAASLALDEDEADAEILVEDELIEVDEMEVLREELLLTAEPLPEVSSTDVLSRDLSRLAVWTKQTSFDEEEQEEIADTATKLHGSELMEQYLAHLKSEEQKHSALLQQLTALDEDEATETSTPSDTEAAESLPLDYYL